MCDRLRIMKLRRRKKSMCLVGLLIVVLECVTATVAQAKGQDASSCENSLVDTIEPCQPCLKDKWGYMVSPTPVDPPGPSGETCNMKKFFRKDEKCVGETITETSGCFNSDPSEIVVSSTGSLAETVSEGEAVLDAQKTALGFAIPETPFFRYFLPPAAKQKGDYDKFDIGQVRKYYVDVQKQFDTDFELFEWPGRKAADFVSYLEERSKMSYGCIDDKVVEVDGIRKCAIPRVYIMLAFQRSTSKFLNYACNSIRGTHVVAYGHVTTPKQEELDDPNVSPTQKIWLSHGTSSIHQEYIQPIYIRNATLMELMNPDPDGTRCKNLGELRTVVDFIFSTERVVLGMKCGILAVRHIMDSTFKIIPAKLLTESSLSSYFPDEINKVAGNVCCGTRNPEPGSNENPEKACEKEKHIIAAYSYNSERKPDGLKYLYISFDWGNRFEKKIIAPVTSLINLIQSMYRIYDRWDYYYKMLEPLVSDSVDSNSKDPEKDAGDTNVFEYFHKYDVWNVLTPEEKANFVYIHAQGAQTVGKYEEGRRRLKRAFCTKTKEYVDKTMGRKPPSPSMKEDWWYPDTDYTPQWVRDSIAERYREYVEKDPDNEATWDRSKWNQIYCEDSDTSECAKHFEEDKVVEELLKDYTGNPVDTYISEGVECPGQDVRDGPYDDTRYRWKERTKAFTKKQNPDETYCLEVVSMVVLQEDYNILFLCKVGYCQTQSKSKSGPSSNDADCTSPPPKASVGERYAIFKASVQPKVPIVYPVRRSKRIFQCLSMKDKLDNDGKDIEPAIIPIPSSGSIFIVNCQKVIYFSANSGKTIFNTVFYFKKTDATDPKKISYQRNFQYDDLVVPPNIAVDASGSSVHITFSNMYAFGVLNYNREFRMFVGKVFEKPPDSAMHLIKDAESVAIPWFTNSGEAAISLIVINIIKDTDEYKQFYESRPGIRFVNVPISFYKDIKPFYAENTKALPAAIAKRHIFQDCNTYSFSIKPTSAKLDIGESAIIRIQVTDDAPLLPLSVYTNEEQGLHISVALTNRSREDPNEIIKHDWDVNITAVQSFRPKEEALIDAFFGAEYSNMHHYSTHVVLVNLPTVRCHVQPSGSVATKVDCVEKVVVAHEDEYRPQCKFTFVNNFNYTLKSGEYDLELARYWFENNPEFVQREDNGDLRIVYDFTTFGCPLEPYQEDEFSPDLRVLTADIRQNSTLGEHSKFNGSFILLEIFGANNGYSYTYTVDEAGYNVSPQTSQQMLREWIIRRRIFNVTGGMMKKWMNHKEPARDSFMFDGSGVHEHLNIWNRVNYRSCIQPGNHPPLTEEQRNQKYQILNNAFINESAGHKEPNKLHWDPRRRPKILRLKFWGKFSFLFLAIAVESDGTLCNYFTWFGVSLPKAQELEDKYSFICFLIFTLLWIFLVVMGYWCRKSAIRQSYIDEARAERLKQAAWTVIYRYEKLLHEKENKQLESGITDFTHTLNQRDRERGYEHVRQLQAEGKSQKPF